MSKGWQAGAITAVTALSIILGGCSSQSSRVEHYVSPQAQVEGENQKIHKRFQCLDERFRKASQRNLRWQRSGLG
jgi:ABC-type uncharacterized transport system auxiliary subunit